jgi:hypothetical protein
MPRRWPFLAAAFLLGCTQESKLAEYEPPRPISTSFDRLTSVLAGIQKARDTALYEGLPSEFWEPQVLERELNEKKSIKLHGYLFYEDLLMLKEDDAAQLTALFSAKDSFQRYRSQKACGGYHADYCVEWKGGGGEAVNRALICLECGEVKLFGPQSELYCDLSDKAARRLKPLLSGYRKNRPASELSQ